MIKKEKPVYLPLTEKDGKQASDKPCRSTLTKVLIVICSLAEVAFVCTCFIIQFAYNQDMATLEFGKTTRGFRWGMSIMFYAMTFLGSYRFWCYYSAMWRLQNNPGTNMNSQNLVSCCGISFAVLSFALEMSFLSLALASTAGLPGAPRLMIMGAGQLLAVACCRVAVELARNNRSRCSLSGPIFLIHFLHVILLASFLILYGPLKGACYSGLDYSSHTITAQCKPDQISITVPCWLENSTNPLTLSMDSVLSHKAKTVSSTTPFEISFCGETKKIALVVSYLEWSWMPKVYSSKVPQFSCAILEHDYCRSCSIEELSRLQVQISVQKIGSLGEDIGRVNSDNRCLLPQAYEMEHNSTLSFRYCLSAGL